MALLFTGLLIWEGTTRYLPKKLINTLLSWFDQDMTHHNLGQAVCSEEQMLHKTYRCAFLPAKPREPSLLLCKGQTK